MSTTMDDMNVDVDVDVDADIDHDLLDSLSCTLPIISTTSRLVTQHIRLAFLHAFAFHHSRAFDHFTAATRLDPRCAIAWFGIAWSLGANYNKTWDLFPSDELKGVLPRIQEATRRAIELVRSREDGEDGEEVERALIEAIVARLPKRRKSNGETASTTSNMKSDIDQEDDGGKTATMIGADMNTTIRNGKEQDDNDARRRVGSTRGHQDESQEGVVDKHGAVISEKRLRGQVSAAAVRDNKDEEDDEVTDGEGQEDEEPFSAWNERYTSAMRRVYQTFYRDDDDVDDEHMDKEHDMAAGDRKSRPQSASDLKRSAGQKNKRHDEGDGDCTRDRDGCGVPEINVELEPSTTEPSSCAKSNTSTRGASSWNLTLAFLFAESLMVETPWRLWDLQTGERAPRSHVLEVRRVLEHALASPGGSRHPGLLHLYVHAMEQSPTPEVALEAADTLRNGVMPDAGHLLHMPSHLDLLVGEYGRAVEANRRGIDADGRWRRQLRGKRLGFYAVYVLHNYTSLIYAAMLAANYRTSIEYTKRLEDVLRDGDLAGLDHFVEPMWATRVMVWVRFGKWQDVLDGESLVKDATKYPITTAFGYYGRGIALAALGRVDEAAEQRELYVSAIARVPSDRLMFPNKASDVLPIGTAMLDGEIAYRRRDYNTAWKHLERAVELYDALVYGEPWSWMQPTRHTLGALKLEQGHVQEAIEVFADDLGLPGSRLARPFQHPGNIWAMKGFRECLRRLGRTEELAEVDAKIENAKKWSDVEIEVGCLCARGAGA